MFFGGDFGDFGGHGHGHGRGRPQKKAPVDNSKLYELLGVSKTADAAEIKKAYRKQALQHHPDRGGDPEKFKELSKAHEILSDADKRALYDEGGEEAVNEGAAGGGGGPAGMDIFDIFGGGFGGRGGGGRSRVRRGEDVVFPLKVTLEDLYNGCAKKLRLTKNVLCNDCGGKGGKGGKDVTCRECKGQGVKMMIRQIGPGMIQQAQVQCTGCKGSGAVIADKDKCQTCAGDKTIKEKKTLEIHVNKGMKHGEKITFKGEADEAPDQTPGDVVVLLQQQEHAVFRRDGANLFHKHKLTLVEALTGFSFPLHHLDGRTLLLKSAPGEIVKPGDVKALREEGMPMLRNPYVRGNLYIELVVDFSEFAAEGFKLSDASKKVLKQVLPAPTGDAASAAAAHAAQLAAAGGDASMSGENGAGMEEVTLVSVDFEAEKRKFEQQAREQRQEEEEDDDDDDPRRHHGHGQPQCRQQ